MASESIPTKTVIPQQVLDSLCSRFILNIPTEESSDLIRAFFQIELAHWFYIDFYRVEQQNLPNLGIREFARIIFNHCPSLLEHAGDVDAIHAAWKEYKKNVPTYGAILLDDKLQYILMVQSFLSRTSWGFPKGKVNKDEKPHQCAIREVREETGFDISQLLDSNNYIELTINEGLSRLYVVPNVPMETVFKPMTRGEIKDVRWFNINDLPLHKKDQAPRVNLGLNPNNFFMVIPFMRPLKKKIASMKGPKNIKSRDSAFTPTILKNPARHAANADNKDERGSPLRQIQNKEVHIITDNASDQRKSRQQQMFEQGCKEEWDKYFCGIEDAGRMIEADSGHPKGYKTSQKGKELGSPLKVMRFPVEDIASDSSKIPTDQREETVPIPYSKSDVNFNILLDFRLNIESVQQAFEESLWAK